MSFDGLFVLLGELNLFELVRLDMTHRGFIVHSGYGLHVVGRDPSLLIIGCLVYDQRNHQRYAYYRHSRRPILSDAVRHRVGRLGLLLLVSWPCSSSFSSLVLQRSAAQSVRPPILQQPAMVWISLSLLILGWHVDRVSRPHADERAVLSAQLQEELLRCKHVNREVIRELSALQLTCWDDASVADAAGVAGAADAVLTTTAAGFVAGTAGTASAAGAAGFGAGGVFWNDVNAVVHQVMNAPFLAPC